MIGTGLGEKRDWTQDMPSAGTNCSGGSKDLDPADVATASVFCSFYFMPKTKASLRAQFFSAVWGVSSWKLSLGPCLL